MPKKIGTLHPFPLDDATAAVFCRPFLFAETIFVGARRVPRFYFPIVNSLSLWFLDVGRPPPRLICACCTPPVLDLFFIRHPLAVPFAGCHFYRLKFACRSLLEAWAIVWMSEIRRCIGLRECPPLFVFLDVKIGGHS